MAIKSSFKNMVVVLAAGAGDARAGKGRADLCFPAGLFQCGLSGLSAGGGAPRRERPVLHTLITFLLHPLDSFQP